MRYFYQYGYRAGGFSVTSPPTWNTTSLLIETTEDVWKDICKLENNIKNKSDLPWWHCPTKSETIPKGYTVLLPSTIRENVRQFQRSQTIATLVLPSPFKKK